MKNKKNEIITEVTQIHKKIEEEVTLQNNKEWNFVYQISTELITNNIITQETKQEFIKKINSFNKEQMGYLKEIFTGELNLQILVEKEKEITQILSKVTNGKEYLVLETINNIKNKQGVTATDANPEGSKLSHNKVEVKSGNNISINNISNKNEQIENRIVLRNKSEKKIKEVEPEEPNTPGLKADEEFYR